jgi:hypothetical protein
MNQHVTLTFTLKYLVNFAKSSTLSAVVQLMMSNDVPLLVSDPPPLIIFSSHVDRLRSLIVVVSIPPEFSSGITLRLKSETSGREGEPTICRRLVNILRHLINLASVCLGSCSQKQIAGVTYRLLGWYIYIAHMLIRIYLF